MAMQEERVEGSAAPAAPNAAQAASKRTDATGLGALLGVWAGLLLAASGRAAAAAVWPIASVFVACAWYGNSHRAVRIESATKPPPAVVHRLFLRPLQVFLAVLLAGGLFDVVFDFKHGSFVWEVFPPITVGRHTYAWPGVYGAELLQHDDPGGSSWYATGGPYAPLPSDSPDAAAFRVTRYLAERFDVDADSVWMTDVLARSRKAAGPATSVPASSPEAHPYAAGMAEIEERYEAEARGTLLLRTTAGVVALLLLGAVVIRVGVARPPRWTESRVLSVSLALLVVALLVTTMIWPDVNYAVFRAALPLLRFHAEHAFVVTTAGVLLAAWLLRSAYRRAQAVAAELATPPRAGPSDVV